MDRRQLNLIRELMEVGFVLVETNLYLDTHPRDERALRLHNTYSKKYSELKKMHQDLYGPLEYTGMSRCPWAYINSPWPWEIDYSKC